MQKKQIKKETRQEGNSVAREHGNKGTEEHRIKYIKGTKHMGKE